MIVLAYGMPGAGKSTLLHDLVREHAHAKRNRLFILDHELGWIPEAAHWRGKPPAEVEVIDGEEAFAQVSERDFFDWPEFGVHVFSRVEGEDVAALLVRLGTGIYVDDEIDTLAVQSGWRESSLRKIVHQGRHIVNDEGHVGQCHILGACRRPQSLHTDVSTLMSQVYIFRVQGVHTIERIRKDSMARAFNDDGKTLMEESAVLDRLQTQPDFHFLHWPSGLWNQIPPLGGKKAHDGHAGATSQNSPATSHLAPER